MDSWSHGLKFEARPENDSLYIKLFGSGEDSREAVMHMHYYRLADILSGWAASLAREPAMDESHRVKLGKWSRRPRKPCKRPDARLGVIGLP